MATKKQQKRRPAAKVTKKTAKKPVSAKRPTATLPTTTAKLGKMDRIRRSTRGLLARRPHRSFRRTLRRDYTRSLTLPGYIAFTSVVGKTLWRQKKTYIYLVLVATVVTAVFAGVASQAVYTQLSSTLREAGNSVFGGGWGEVGKAGLLLLTGVSGSFSTQPTEAQQTYGIIILLFTWLTTIWLLRAQLAGGALRLRDALYNAGSPVISTTLLLLLFMIQLIPMSLAYIGYNAAIGTGLLSSGFISLIFFIVAVLLVLVTLYLITSTFIALVVVTLPGMYPWQALRTAGDLVTGRRLRILLRLAWLTLVVVIVWVVIMVPVILLTTWLQTSITQTSWIPIVPAVLTILSSATVVFVSSYIYLLYRGMVDDGSAPA